MNRCKMCKNELTNWWQDTYCSNECKFADPELNARRARKEKNDKSKQLRCNICGHITSDILNLGGHAKKHLVDSHNITDTYQNYYTAEDAAIIKTWQCPICEWKTKDLLNISGCITTHIIKTHNIGITIFTNKYPENSNLFDTQISETQRNQFLLKAENNIECKICGLKFYKLSNSHLQIHGITPSEYKTKFGIQNTSSKKTIKLQSQKSNNSEIKEKMIRSLLKTNNEKFGMNSYSQTVAGKNLIRAKTLQNTYTKYISSKKLSEHVKLLFDISDYNGNIDNEYKFLCKKCNSEFYGKLENGRIPRCFSCYPKINKGYSNTEKEIASFIKNDLHVDILENHKINGVEIDIYIPSHNLGIEFDGLYWHSEINGNKNRNYHLNKTEKCEELGIFLIHIFEDEWIYKKDVVKSKLKIALGLMQTKIYARKCKIREITTDEKNIFLDLYHLQGADNIAMHKLGLFHDNELISVISFTKYKYIKNLDMTYELSRFATKNDILLVGGFSKFLKYFINTYHPKSILTFADRRWSKKDNAYLKNGFKFLTTTDPSYWYFDKSHNRQHRFNYRKSLLEKKLIVFDDTLSEWDNMQLNGYDRIWDCGSFKYEMVI